MWSQCPTTRAKGFSIIYDELREAIHGKKYHRDGCRYLATSKVPISLKDAKAKGYTACKVCHPPE